MSIEHAEEDSPVRKRHACSRAASECIFPLLEIKAAFAFTMRAFILGIARSRGADVVDRGQTGD